MEVNEITRAIIGCAYAVSNALGVGFLERVYENALAHELRKAGFHVSQQHRMQVRYDGVVVGDYVADLLVEGQVLIELKVAQELRDAHFAFIRAHLCHLCASVVTKEVIQ